jgi:uncharacterized membrane protein YedE/YeeE
MEHFTPIASSVGGILIGISAVLLLYFNGRIAGISGVAGQILSPKEGDLSWRLAFVAGLIIAGIATFVVTPELFAIGIERSHLAVGLAGLFVGFGTRLGSGCTSGHGVCGLGRLSVRSLASVVTFMISGALVVFLVRALFGGSV